jgi:hypothetical protein
MSATQARRMLLGAQGFASRAPTGPHGRRRLESTVRRIAPLQIDSVNVFARSHYLPLFSRIGAYEPAALDSLAFGDRRRLTEYWAHEAALIPIEDWPLWGWKMAALRERDARRAPWVQENPAMLDWLREYLAASGPTLASAIEHESAVRRGPWWGWSEVKRGLEHLFAWGEVAIAGRTRFERRYGLAEHVLPAAVLGTAIPRPDAIRELVARSAVALGIGTLADLADVHRLRVDDTKAAVLELQDAGVLERVAVEGWRQSAWRHRDARRPRRIDAAAILTPFDPVTWDRDRALRHFGFHYRIEIYTPAPKRVFGYYSLPILLDDAIVGRIDLKADRAAGSLLVQSAWREESAAGAAADPHRVAEVVSAAAAWQRLDRVIVRDRGTLARDLGSALGVRMDVVPDSR